MFNEFDPRLTFIRLLSDFFPTFAVIRGYLFGDGHTIAQVSAPESSNLAILAKRRLAKIALLLDELIDT
jgi:hypothetical protein